MKKLIFISLVLIFVFPLAFIRTTQDCVLEIYLLRSTLPVLMVALFWFNYLYLVPRLRRCGSMKRLMLENLASIILCLTLQAGIHVIEFNCEEQHRIAKIHHADMKGGDAKCMTHPPKIHKKKHFLNRKEDFLIFSAITDTLYLVLSVLIAYSILATRRVDELHRKQEEAEAARSEAELRALRNQVSPHFLLNTLNNIYSLSLMNNGRVSDAVMQLSHLLRHLLYESQGQRVLLRQEAEFIRSYITLMHMRLTSNITVNTNLDIAPDSSTEVAPLIFVSLLENAFKHGTCPSCPCQIDISLYEENGIHFRIVNSLHPKTQKDRSGHGIGLDLVKKRLELYYPKSYNWKYGAEGENWISDLHIWETDKDDLI